jgi:hypothetical protein
MTTKQDDTEEIRRSRLAAINSAVVSQDAHFLKFLDSCYARCAGAVPDYFFSSNFWTRSASLANDTSMAVNLEFLT